MIEITSAEDERIQLFRSLKEQWNSSRVGVPTPTHSFCLAEGEKLCIHALKSSWKKLAMLALPAHYERHAELIRSSSLAEEAQFTCTREVFEKIVGFSMRQEFLLLLEPPRPVPLKELQAPIVALNALSDSENVGAIIRTCRAMGVSSLLIDHSSASPYLRRAMRVSMGGIFGMMVHVCDDLVLALDVLRSEHELRVIALEQHERAQALPSLPYSAKRVLVFGSEADGIDAKVLAACDDIYTIPMESSVDSLNVAATAAIALYVLSRKT